MERERGYDPDLIRVPPMFQSPSRPAVMVRWLLTNFLWPQLWLWIAIAALMFHFFTPGIDRFVSLSIDDVGLVWVRNVGMMLIVIGGQHWWLHMKRAQETDFKYEDRWLARNRKSFLFDDQTKDNMFWSLVGGAGIAALYEAIMFNLYASGSIPHVESLLAIALVTFVLFWLEGVHFYFTHRLLHIGPIYSRVHALHHRNVNTGPWSGISMHPLEHVVYFSLVLVFLVVPGSPFIATFCCIYLILSPSTSHSGFHRFKLGKDFDIQGGNYFHNLHHRYFEVNYGMQLLPLDKWLGTFHDGSLEAHEAMKSRRHSLDAVD